MKRTIVVVLTCMVLASICSAADKWENITKKDGLPSNKINFIQQDNKGNIWVGTMNGLARYKDGKIKVFLEGQKIWEMTPADTNEYWVGIGGGIVMLEKDEIVWEKEKKKGKRKKAVPFFSGHTPAPILPFKEDKYWVLGKATGGQKNVVAHGNKEGWEPVPFFKKKSILDLFLQKNGTIWAVEDGKGVYEVKPDEEIDKTTHHLDGFNVTDMAEDSDGNIWCGVWDRGVRVYKGGEWDSHLTAENTYVFNITEDSRGNIWVATSSSGLWEYDGKEWKNHLEDEQINMLATTPNGRVWVSTQRKGGLRYWNGKKWQYALDNRLPFRCVFESKDGRVWAGSVLGGVFVNK